MQEVSFFYLPGQEAHGRLAVIRDNGNSRLLWQITAPRDWQITAPGRPVEELPRLLARYSPSHHLAAAQALDQLFGVEPPELAINCRECLRQVDILRHHLRRLYFLLTLWEPDQDWFRRRRPQPPAVVWRDKIQQHLALAREAATIIGGRPEHPLTAVVGGFSRFLKPEQRQRLAQISRILVDFAQALADFVTREILSPERSQWLTEVTAPPLATLTLAPTGNQLRRQQPDGREELFPLAEVWQRLGRQQEPWTYEPLAYWQAEGWPGLTGSETRGLMLVGPLARVAAAPPAEGQTESAEPASFRGRLDLATAFRALLQELQAAAQTLVALAQEEKLTGPQLRTIPTGWGELGQAAVEGPSGLICLACRADNRGLITELQLLDPDMLKPAFLNLVLQNWAPEVASATAVTKAWRQKIAIGLLPW